MAQYNIKWKKGDLIRLGRAVSQFNKKINELNRLENKSYLPEERNYQELKDTIKTRNELNKVINSLKRFSKEGAEDLYITEAGEQLTKWERRELSINLRSISRQLNKEIKKLGAPITPEGFTKLQMGSLEGSALERRLKNFAKIESVTGAEFKRLKSRILMQGESDYQFKKASTWKENYINTFKKYSHLDNYDLLEKKFKELSNPIEFFNFFQADELTGDLTYNSDSTYSQEAFNNFLERLGIGKDLEDTITSE